MRAETCPHCGTKRYPATGIEVIDLLGCQITVKGVEVILPRREMLILRFLLDRSPSYVTREALHEYTYGLREDGMPAEATIESHVSKLRTRLRQHGADCTIESTRYVGYALKPLKPLATMSAGAAAKSTASIKIASEVR